MTLRRRLNDSAAASLLETITPEMEIIENHTYFKLLMMCKGELSAALLIDETKGDVDRATVGYGVGNWYYYNGQKEEARKIFMLAIGGRQWAAFGYIAAEAELTR
jgi:hypothetical protein